MTFDEAFLRLIGHEGGYTKGDGDPGGETKYGISKRAYPGEDIKNLTLDRAKEIYRRDYWGPAGCDALPDAARFDVFDFAVNSGVRTSVKLLQRVVNETEDGQLGPRTLQAVQSMPAPRLAARIAAERLLYMTTLATWPAFGRGWVRRVALNLREA